MSRSNYKPKIARICLWCPLLCALLVGRLAAATIEFELVTQPGAPTLSTQQWYQTLTELGVSRLQIRGARAEDKIEVVSRKLPDSIHYLVRGVLTPNGQLILPGGRFRTTDRARVAAWLERLQSEGPPPAPGEERRWGLDATRIEAVKKDLARPVGMPTLGRSRGEVLSHVSQLISGRLTGVPLDSVAARPGEEIQVELRELSVGTALAYLLRDSDLAFEPRRNERGEVDYHVQPLTGSNDPWPVGVESSTSPRETLPAMFEFLNAEIDSIPIEQVLDVLGERLGVPVLIDRRAIARAGIDLASVEVSYPAKRTFYADLLSKLAFQAKLRADVRVDEAQRPLLWVTTLRGD